MSEVLIRQIDIEDYKALSAFLSEFPGDEKTPQQWLDRFRYWWEENPAFDENWIRGFVIVAEEKIVGFVGSFPTLFKNGNQILKAFNGTTWRVSESYRNHSIDLWMKNREISNRLLSFNTTPTDTVIKLITTINYKLLPWGSEQESVYILKPFDYAKQLFPSKPAIFSWLISCGIRLRQLTYIKSKHIEISFEVLEKADKRFDELWKKTANRYDYTNVRTSDAVNWYCRNKLLTGIFRGNTLTGYMILSESATGIRDLSVADVWAQNESELEATYSAMVDFAVNLARERNCTLIRFPHFKKELTEIYHKKGLPGKSISRRNYYRKPTTLTNDFNSGNSYFSLLQGDYGI